MRVVKTGALCTVAVLLGIMLLGALHSSTADINLDRSQLDRDSSPSLTVGRTPSARFKHSSRETKVAAHDGYTRGSQGSKPSSHNDGAVQGNSLKLNSEKHSEGGLATTSTAWTLQPHDGPVQRQSQVFITFWGGDWNKEENAYVKQHILDFFEWLSGSSYAEILTQYFDDTGPISSTVKFKSYTDTRAEHYPQNVGYEKLEDEIAYGINNREGWGPVTIDKMYFVLPAPGTTYKEGANELAPPGECAWHQFIEDLNGNADFDVSYALIPWFGDQRFIDDGCWTWPQYLWEEMQAAVSHEWAESVTDPVVPTGWTSSFGLEGEVADYCESATVPNTTIFVDKLWDNSTNDCKLSHPNPPRYEVTSYDPTLSGHSATLRGAINSGGPYSTSYHFEFTGPNGTVHIPAPDKSLYGGNTVEVQEPSGPLKGETTYSVRLVGTNEISDLQGATKQFTTPDWRPQVTIKSQANVKAGKATLKGEVHPQGYDTHYRFEWGTVSGNKFDHSIPVPDAEAGAGTSAVPVDQTIEGIKGQTEYQYRIYASNQEGSHTSSAQAFTTPDWRPAVTTNAQSIKVTEGDVRTTFSGTVNPEGFATTYHFEWGDFEEEEKGEYNHHTEEASVGSGESPVSVEQTVTEIKANVGGYHFRLVATNAEGVTTGPEKVFTSPNWMPHAYSLGADIGRKETTLRSKLLANGIPSHYHFKWATQAEYEKGEYNHLIPVPDAEAGSSTEAVGISQILKSLEQLERYHFRVVAANSEGSSTSEEDFTFLNSIPGFWADQYTAILQGNVLDNQEFAFGTLVASCNVNLSGTMSAASESLTFGGAPSCSGSATMNMNGCELRFRKLTDNYNGSATQIICPSGKAIQLTAKNGLGATCAVSVPAQSGLTTGIEQLEGAPATVEVKLSGTLEYSGEGGGAGCPSGVKKDGGWLGTWKMKAFNEAASQIGLHLTDAFQMKPKATTEAASKVELGKATLNGKVNPDGLKATYHFEYGTTTAYGTSIPLTDKEVGSGFTDAAVAQTIESGLAAETTYHYRLVATNSEGTAYGVDKQFTTPDWRPAATTEAVGAGAGKTTEAVLNGTVNPKGIATTYQFEYGATTSYGSKAPASAKSAGSGTGNVKVSETLTGLKPQTTYHYRLVASSAGGTGYGEDLTFTTPAPHPIGFTAESYPATLAGDTANLEYSASPGSEYGTVKCTATHFASSLSATASTVPLSVESSGCSVTLGGTKFPVTVEMKSCLFDAKVSNSGSPYVGTLGVSCSKEGDTIAVKTYNAAGTSVKCTDTIAPQSGLSGLSYANLGSGSERGVETGFKVESVANTTSGGILNCGISNGAHTGKLTTSVKLTGKDGSNANVGTFISGDVTVGTYLTGAKSEEKAAQPRVAAESYPVSLAGDTANLEYSASPGSEYGTVKCTATHFASSLSATASTVPLSVESSGCSVTLGGTKFPVTVEMKSCHFDANVSNSGPPYVGTLGVACTKEGDTIAVKTFTAGGESVKCTDTIAPQSGLSGLSYANLGSGSGRGVETGFKVESVANTTSGSLLNCGISSGAHTGSLIGSVRLYGF